MAGEWRKNRRRRNRGRQIEEEKEKKKRKERERERERESQRDRESEGQRAGTQEKREKDSIEREGLAIFAWRKGGKHTGSVPSAQLG